MRTRTLALVAIITAAVASIGCQSIREVADKTQEVRDVALREREIAQSIIDDPNATPTQREQAQVRVEAFDKAIEYADKQLAIIRASQAPDGSMDVGAAIATAGGMLPPPVGTVAMIAAPFAALAAGWLRDRRALQSVVDGIEKARAETPELKDAMAKAKATIDGALTTHARTTIVNRKAAARRKPKDGAR